MIVLPDHTDPSLEKICTVLEIISSVSADLTLDEILNNITRQVVEVMSVDSCAISLWDSVDDAVISMADYISPAVVVPENDIDDLGLAYPLQNYPATARVLKEKKPLIVRVDDPTVDKTERKLLQSYKWAVVLMLPMVYKEQATGLMELYLKNPKSDVFSDEDVYLCQVMANQVAIAIENTRVIAELTAQREELRELSLQLVNAQENETRRIARDLHDQLGQNLTALRINLDIVNQSLPSGVSPRLINSLKEARNLAAYTQEMTRNLWQNLHPPILDELGLVSALYWVIDRHEQYADLHIDFQDDLPNEPLGPELDITIYRIIIEALTNVVRHAKAKNVLVNLHTENGCVVICVKDDGLGFDADQWSHPGRDRQSLGLIGMQERVKLLNGELQVKSKPDAGTEITVLLPCQG